MYSCKQRVATEEKECYKILLCTEYSVVLHAAEEAASGVTFNNLQMPWTHVGDSKNWDSL